MPTNKNGELSTLCIMSAIPCKYWVFCFFFIAFYGIIRAMKRSRRHMAGNSKDLKILAYKDMINQLNKTISAQTELIQSLQKTLEADRLEKENLRQQIEYLTKKLFVYWSSFLVTLCSEIMLYIETPLVSYSYSLNEVSHSCTS